jgi:sialic acid synthase SpsE
VIEKHFTLDKKLPGPDQPASLDPEELRQMVTAIRNVERALGDGKKMPRRSERAVARVARKSIVAVADIVRGTRLSPEMLAAKRPGTGIEPKYLDELVGKIVKADIGKDQLLTWDLLQ